MASIKQQFVPCAFCTHAASTNVTCQGVYTCLNVTIVVTLKQFYLVAVHIGTNGITTIHLNLGPITFY